LNYAKSTNPFYSDALFRTPFWHTAQRLALPAGGGLGGKNYQTQNPPLGLNPLGRGKAPARPRARDVGRF